MKMKKYKLIVNGEKYETKVLSYNGNYAKINVNGIDYEIEIEQDENRKRGTGSSPEKISVNHTKVPPVQHQTIKSTPPQAGSVLAPIPGMVIDIKVKIGDTVSANDVVLILEAMKMESEIYAGLDGVVKSINISKGDSVQDNELLMEIEG